MRYLSSNRKLLSENPQGPPERIQSPLFTHFAPKNSKKCKSPLCANIENFSDPPCRKGGINYGCMTLGDPPPSPSSTTYIAFPGANTERKRHQW